MQIVESVQTIRTDFRGSDANWRYFMVSLIVQYCCSSNRGMLSFRVRNDYFFVMLLKCFVLLKRCIFSNNTMFHMIYTNLILRSCVSSYIFRQCVVGMPLCYEPCEISAISCKYQSHHSNREVKNYNKYVTPDKWWYKERNLRLGRMYVSVNF